MATIIKFNDIKMNVIEIDNNIMNVTEIDNNILLTKNGASFASSSKLFVLLLK